MARRERFWLQPNEANYFHFSAGVRLKLGSPGLPAVNAAPHNVTFITMRGGAYRPARNALQRLAVSPVTCF